jgi:hypothetical protein
MSLMPPTDALRTAMRDDAWDTAFALIERYDAEVRDAFESPTQRPSAEEASRLVAAHQALMAELTAARDAVAASLQRFQRERRGVHAYLGSGA